MPVLINGNVMPSKTDCGTISAAAAAHFSTFPSVALSIDGSTEEWNASVSATNTSWNSSAMTPMTPSTTA